ncbi:general substrate transporter [Mycena filopes]|nr:general substrate transporter [Mycena filopes]
MDSDNESKTQSIDGEEKPRTRKTPAEQKAELEAALAIDPGYPQLYLVTLVFCINAMKQYQVYFGMSGSGSTTGIVFGIFARTSPDRLGRRFSMFVGNSFLVMGAIITALADSRSQFIGGRFLTGAFNHGLERVSPGTAAKSYLAEITPPTSRGAYLGFLNSFYYVGQTTATGMMVATEAYSTNWSWRLPLLIQIVPAGLNLLFIFFCPESPRWLYTRGRTAEARQVLARFHSSTGDPNSPLVTLEIEEIEDMIALDGADSASSSFIRNSTLDTIIQSTWWDFRPLFRTRGDRWRTAMVVIIGFFGQLSGNGLITYFLPILLRDAGITSQRKQLTLNFPLSGSAMVDRWGRRKNLLSATAGLVVILAIVSGTPPPLFLASPFIFLFNVMYSFGWTAMQGLYPAEVLSFEVRAKGLAFLGLVSQSAQLITTFGMPSAIQALGWKIYLVYMVWDLFECVIIYFFAVETKGLTLEEITKVFEQPNPRNYSIQKIDSVGPLN